MTFSATPYRLVSWACRCCCRAVTSLSSLSTSNSNNFVFLQPEHPGPQSPFTWLITNFHTFDKSDGVTKMEKKINMVISFVQTMPILNFNKSCGLYNFTFQITTVYRQNVTEKIVFRLRNDELFPPIPHFLEIITLVTQCIAPGKNWKYWVR